MLHWEGFSFEDGKHLESRQLGVPAFFWTKHRHPKRGPPILKIKPRLDRGDQRGFMRWASAGPKFSVSCTARALCEPGQQLWAFV